MKDKIKQILSNSKHYVPTASGFRSAAVLIPLFCRNGTDHILFTRRTQTVRNHKGQISFPGGVQDTPDEPLSQTAVRETFEEIGVEPHHIELLGSLDQTLTTSGYMVTPFLGIIPYPYPFQVNPDEVDELIVVPLDFIIGPDHIEPEPFEYEGRTYMTEKYVWEGHVIWGATARIIHIFRETLGSVLRGTDGCTV